MNKEISELLGEPTLVMVIRQQQFRLLGHVQWIPTERVTKMSYEEAS